MWLAGERKKIDEALYGDTHWVSPTEQKAKARKIAKMETLAAYGRRWITERRNSRGEPLRALTRKDYEQILAKYIVPTLGRMHVDEITRADVRQWHAGLADAGQRTRTKAYALLRAIMNIAVDDELIAASPVHIRGAGAAAVRRPVEPATPDEIQVMAESMPPRLSAAPIIAAWCALRYGEIAELRRKDIDVANHQIKVRRAVTFPHGGPWSGRRSRTPVSATSQFLHTSGRSSSSTSKPTSGPRPTRCCSRARHEATCGTRSWAASSPRPGRSLVATTSSGTTFDTRGPPWPPRLGRPQRSCKPVSGTQPRWLRSCISTRRRIVTGR